MSDWDFLQRAYKREDFKRFLAGTDAFYEHLVAIPTKQKGASDMHELGTISTSDGKNIAVFEVKIDTKTQLPRNRVGLRNLVLRHVKKDAGDGALAVYIDEENSAWRLSFIAIKPEFNEEGELILEETESKRFTYLLGENIQTRTVRERLSKITSESSLDDITEAFAVEPLTREFFTELFKWYQRAQKSVAFPNDEGVDNHIQISLIRLLTRLLFVWFIKKKNLVNHDLFEEDKLKQFICWEKDSSYYKAILQNLFFATLNQEVGKRCFRNRTSDSNTGKKGEPNSDNYLVTNIYRYQNYFRDSDEAGIINRFFNTPFLNGGLFDCLDRDATKEEQKKWSKKVRAERAAVRVDGFSDRKENKISFPNSLFFNNSERNLGLINLLNRYQFTVEESTSLDVEVALDPELLGRVFENLLADYNPETRQQARKSTGSFYTPRHIVSDMIDNSMKRHFLQNADALGNLTEEQINGLFDEHQNKDSLRITSSQAEKLIDEINGMKIIDPAIGSGAFSMGCLQRMVNLLRLIDPDNKNWKKSQLKNLPSLEEIAKDLEIARQIGNERAKKKAEEELEKQRDEIMNNFEGQDHDYSRKLYLIQNCIYGVDIQPIAIQICKLRFFISLTIEQEILPQNKANAKKNYGITPLPNLETKFIAANTLLPLQGYSEMADFFDNGFKPIRHRLGEVRERYFRATTRQTKRILNERLEKIRADAEAMLNGPENNFSGHIADTIKKIVYWDWRNQNAHTEWFNPELQFGVSEGFDIVIGNPPYVTYGLGEQYNAVFKAPRKKIPGVRNTRNLFAYFIEKGLSLCGASGILTYIVPHSLSRVNGYQYVRDYINNHSTLISLVDEYNPFENVTLEMITLLCSKVKLCSDDNIKSFSRRESKNFLLPSNVYRQTGYYPMYYDSIFKKMRNHCTYRIDGNRGKDSLRDNNGSRLLLGGKNINEYVVIKGHGEHLIADDADFRLDKKLLVITQFGAPLRGTIIDTKKYIPSGGCVIVKSKHYNIYFLLALINSKLIKAFFHRHIINCASLTVHLDGHYLSKIPVPEVPEDRQLDFAKLAEQTLAAKAKDAAADTSALENQIDELVYQLYDLDDDEIAIIDPTRVKPKKPKGKG